MLPRRKERPEKPERGAKRESRWRSPAHTGWVSKEFACCNCGSETNVVAAHVRYGSHTGIGQKPDDWRTVPLCDGPFSNAGGGLGCHGFQHRVGEPTFWRTYSRRAGQTVEQLIDELCRASPKAREIADVKRERVGA